MAEFLCKVADGSGKVFLQVEAAESMTEARQKLSDRGLFVYNVRPRAGVLGPVARPDAARNRSTATISWSSTSNSTR